ncbi:MAG: leucine-rich repeat domain-containing protein [Thiotrichaceae bacterium]|nr:leucine-rich repeat domain-containing protein [Thiotrichaceae bacterium]
MPTDLEIIQQLEQEIWPIGSLFGKKLKRISLDAISGSHNGYAADKNNNIIGLNLDKNNISFIPSSLFYLKYLTKLSLFGNQIDKLPVSFGQLQNLRILWLNENQLKELPTSFGQLQKLSYLELQYNQLKELPVSFGQLQNLEYLELQHNQLRELPASFGQLKNLRYVYINSNKISRLPKEILSLNLEPKWGDYQSMLGYGMAVKDNPLVSPPVEVIQRGQQAVYNYFEQLKQGD